jgi:glycosyltransferase involved in cell wall biosynthesis
LAGTPAVRYYGGGDLTGYGLAAIGYVRMLVHAGVPVEWIPLRWGTRKMQPSGWYDETGAPLQALQSCRNDAGLADLPALIQATSRGVGHETVIVHAPPEVWADTFESGRRNIGCVAWETDRPPAYWWHALHRADHIVVPCTQNRDAFLRAGVARPIDVIGHVRREAWHACGAEQCREARVDLGIPEHHRIFYSISTWEPRKHVAGLIDAFARAFRADDPVTLLIKTMPRGHGDGPLYEQQPTRALAQAAIARAARGREAQAPSIRLIDDLVDGATVDLLHRIGAVYASTSRGEGFGLGAFEAATLGRPVIMTGWGGQTDYLGPGWPGEIAYRLVAAPLWPPLGPSFFPSMRWAEPDLDHAARLMREVVDAPGPHLAAAAETQARIAQQFAEPVLARDWLRVIRG